MTGRRFFALGVAALVLGVVALWLLLPDGPVPMHYGAGNEVDAWGTRGEMVLTMAGIGAGLAVLMWALAAWVPKMPWSLVNVPDKEHWSRPENEAAGRRRVQDDVYYVGGWTLLVVALMVPDMVVGARRGGELSPFAFLGVLVVMLVLLAWFMVVRMRFYRRPER